MFKINDNRIVKIENETDGKSRDWKQNLSSILDNNSYRNAIKMFDVDGGASLYNVHDDVKLLMTSDPKTFSSINDYETPISDFVGKYGQNKKLSNIGSYLMQGLSYLDAKSKASEEGVESTTGIWQPWMKNVPAWSGSKSAPAFDYTFEFALGQYGLWNAKEEVVKPILNLIAPTLPQYINAFTMAGPYPNAIQLLANLNNQGTSWADAEKEASGLDNENDGFLEGISNKFKTLGIFLEKLITNTYSKYTYTVTFGKVTSFRNMMIVDSKSTFSTEVDQYGYPIKGSVTLQFQGVVPMSITSSNDTNMAARFGGDMTKGGRYV